MSYIIYNIIEYRSTIWSVIDWKFDLNTWSYLSSHFLLLHFQIFIYTVSLVYEADYFGTEKKFIKLISCQLLEKKPITNEETNAVVY